MTISMETSTFICARIRDKTITLDSAMSRKIYSNKEDGFHIWRTQPELENFMYPYFESNDPVRVTTGLNGNSNQRRINVLMNVNNAESRSEVYVNPVASDKIRPSYSNRDPLDSHQAIDTADSGSKHRHNKTSEMRQTWRQGGATLPQDFDKHLRVHNKLPFDRFNNSQCVETVGERIQKIKKDENSEAKAAKQEAEKSQ